MNQFFRIACINVDDSLYSANNWFFGNDPNIEYSIDSTHYFSTNCNLVIVGLDEKEISTSPIYIYPNPAINILNIDVSNSLNYGTTLYDSQGRRIISKINQPAIEIQNLPQGIYLLEVKDLDSGQVVIEKIIKEK